ncbi:hypothetical protein L6452_09565 [Arctium lappa]|uniref:Uncharacterized protein n=1 Tax=Arctium lappa TaxID=4217 RepID=A0ACB9DKW5_ARCLA|nr:hypothetical protein L6452_09565 [Arctium lappa]
MLQDVEGGFITRSISSLLDLFASVRSAISDQVSSEAEHCLTVVLSQYDSSRCLSVIVPLLVTEDEKTLVTCINCLTKLIKATLIDDVRT